MQNIKLIRKNSSLTYSMKNPVHAWTGISDDFTVDVSFNKKEKTITSVEATAQVAAFDSGIPKRDREALKELNAKRFPTVSFTSESIEQSGESLRVKGTLTFHGISKTVSFDVTQQTVGKQLRTKGAFSIKLTDFGIKPPGYLFLKTENNIDLKFKLIFDLNN